jgi:hypothetical protein
MDSKNENEAKLDPIMIAIETALVQTLEVN